MHETSKHIGEGVITIYSEEGEKLYQTLSESGMIWEKLSLIFDEHAKMLANGNNVATKEDVKSILQAVYNLSNKIRPLTIGGAVTDGVSNSPLVESVSNISLDLPEIPASKPEVSFSQRRKKTISFQEMIEISNKQE